MRLRNPLCLLSVLLLLSGVVATAQGQAGTSPELAESQELNGKVVQLYREAKYDEALPLAKRALELREKALGPEHEDLVPVLSNLAELYKVKNQNRLARSLFERALRITEKRFGENDLRTAKLLDKLGSLAFEQNDTADAEKFFQRSLQIKEAVLGADHRDLGQTIFDLAEIHRYRGDYLKAEPFYERLVRLFEKAPGKDNGDLIRAVDGQISTFQALKKTAQAEEAQRRLEQLVGGIVSQGILNGKAVRLAQPLYPAEARTSGASGKVQVQVVIDENGKVISARAANPAKIHPALVAAAEVAARYSLFRPTYLTGKPVKVTGVIIFAFIYR